MMNYMKKTMTYNSYTLGDLFTKNPNTDTPDNVTPANYKSPIEIFAYLDWDLTIELQEILTSPIVTTLWNNYILPKNVNENIVYHPVEEPEETEIRELNKIYGEWFRLFINKIVTTYSRYSTIIELYKNNEASLMNKIQTESINIFNDTPQDIGFPIDNDYATNINKNKVESDGMTLINRLEEIRRKWDNIYIEWCAEFDDLFMEDIEYGR